MARPLESDIESECLINLKDIPRAMHSDSHWKVRFDKWHKQLVENPSTSIRVKMISHRKDSAAQRLRQFQKDNNDYPDMGVKQRQGFTYFFLKTPPLPLTRIGS